MPNQLTQLKVGEVSLVDSGANKHNGQPLARIMLFKRDNRGVLEDGDYPSGVHKRKFTDAERKEDAKSGAAMPGGGYPIEDEADLHNAIRAIGRAKDPGKTKAHIRSRAKALGLTDLLPDTWSKRDSGNATVAYLAKRFPKLAEIAKAYGDGEAVDFDTAQERVEQNEEACGLMDEVNEAVCALSSAIWSIESDDEISDKGEAIQQCLQQFGEHVKTIVPEGVENALVAASLSEGGYAINSLGGIEFSKRGDSMSLKAIAKRLGLDESASPEVILAAMNKADEEKAKKDKDEKEVAEKLDATVRKMSAKHRAFMGHPDAKMPKGGKSAFAEMSSSERDSHMSSNPIDDEDEEDDVSKAIASGDAFRMPTGEIITKKGNPQYSVMKAMNDRLAKAEKDAAESKDKASEKEKTEKASKDLVLIGKADEVGSLLFRIAKHDPKLADQVEAMLKSANDAIEKGGIFKEHGSNHRGADSALQAINAGAQALLKSEPQLKTIEKARTEFRKRNPEIKKREDAEATAARSAR